WESLVLRTDVGMNAGRIAHLLVVEAKRHSDRKRSKPGLRRRTGALYSRREDRMLKRSLSFAIVVEPKFIDRGVAERPGVGNVPLLQAFVDNGTETRHARSGCLEYRERRDQMVIFEVVISAEVLRPVNSMIKPDRKLVGTLRLYGGGNKSTAA